MLLVFFFFLDGKYVFVCLISCRSNGSVWLKCKGLISVQSWKVFVANLFCILPWRVVGIEGFKIRKSRVFSILLGLA